MDVNSLKDYIIDNDCIPDILESLGCHSIQDKGNYYSCANIDGNNKSAIVVYKDTLITRDYTRNIIKDANKKCESDIFTLVEYIEDCNFPQAMNKVCEWIGLDYYHDFEEDLPESLRITQMLLDMITNNDNEEDNIHVKPISEKILSYYKPYVNDMFYKDNISYLTQREFEIGYDESTNRITIPIRSEIGHLVGVKGRLFQTELSESDLKYIYLEPTARRKILYGLYMTIEAIKETGKVYVFESEKSVMQLWSYGYYNSVATGGKELSKQQIEMLVRLGVDIIFCFDKDVKQKELEELAERFPNGVPLYYTFDVGNILEEHESPSDNPKNWEHMIENNIYCLQ